MLYTTITIKDTDYKCRLNAKGCVDLERKLKTNPINVLMEMQDGKLPSLEKVLVIFGVSLKELNHGLKDEDVYQIYDDYCDEGGSLVSFITEVIVPIMSDSGLLPKEDNKEEEGKN